MKRIRPYVLAICLAASLVLPAHSAPMMASFDLKMANVSEVLQLLYGEVVDFHPEVTH